MKKIFLTILALFFLVTIVNAQSLDNTLEKITDLEFDVSSYKVALPLAVTLESINTNEVKTIALEKSGKIIESAKKSDITIKTTLENIESIEDIDSIETLKEFIQSSDITTSSLKGNFLISFAEKQLDIEILKNKSFSQKISSFFGSIIFKIKDIFI
tara:strand:- start:1045 stop:1515 length:471 start_codon:yes stop_codon:yes gene_type:complete